MTLRAGMVNRRRLQTLGVARPNLHAGFPICPLWEIRGAQARRTASVSWLVEFDLPGSLRAAAVELAPD
jgi:hypothetical protein